MQRLSFWIIMNLRKNDFLKQIINAYKINITKE